MSLYTQAQVRYIDTEPHIAYPEEGHYFISPGEDSVVYYIVNNGPDTLFASDKYGTTWKLANVWFNYRFGELGKIVAPGDSVRVKHVFSLNYYNHRPEVDFCVESYIFNTLETDIFKEQDSAVLWENNLTCTTAAHNRVVSVPNIGAQSKRVYPNPASSTIYIDGVDKEMKIKWFTSTGQELNVPYVESANQRVYRLDGLPMGVYYLSFSDGSYSKLVKN